MTLRPAIAILALALPASAAASASDHDPAYTRANAQLARVTPHYPRARLLIEETVHAGDETELLQAINRVYFLASPQTQRTIDRFYARRLGARWRQRGPACHVSGSRLVLTLLHVPRRRLGVYIDSHGASSCAELRPLIGDLLDVGYPP